MSGTRSGSHRIVYWHFKVMKSIWESISNAGPVPFDSILDDNNNVNEDFSHNDEGESGVNHNGDATISLLPRTTTNDLDSNDNENEMENSDTAKSSAECRADLVANTNWL